jgi:hypothetical protein
MDWTVSIHLDSTTRPCAKEAKRSDHVERSENEVLLKYNSNQRAAKARTNAMRPAVCKTKSRELCFDFTSDQGTNAAPEKNFRFLLIT